MTKYFGIPFASAGDKTEIPDTIQPGGEVSYAEGWTADYEAEQGVDPNAKDVDRQKENQFKFDISEAMKEVQERGILPYRADVNYPVNATVIASDSNQYLSLLANGPASSVVDPVGNPATWENKNDGLGLAGNYDIILPVGVYTSGTYMIPNGRTWDDYDIVEVLQSIDTSTDTFSSTCRLSVEARAVAPDAWIVQQQTDANNFSTMTVISSTQFTLASVGGDNFRHIIGYRKAGVA